MSGVLKNNTIAVVLFGPVMYDDGTPYTATLLNSEIRISKNGGAFTAKNESSNGTHLEDGFFQISLNTNDINVNGITTVKWYKSGVGALAHKEDFQIDPEKVYDSLRLGTRNIPVMGVDGYPDGYVFVNSTAGSPGAVPEVNGTKQNPCSTEANLYSLGETGIGTKRGKLVSPTIINAANAYNNWIIKGDGGSCIWNANGQNYDNTEFENLIVYGTITNGGAVTKFRNCEIGNVFGVLTTDLAYFENCLIGNTGLVLKDGNPHTFRRCYGFHDTAEVSVISFQPTAGDIKAMIDFYGSLSLQNMSAGDEVFLTGQGRLVIDATCSGGEIKVISGNWEIIDSSVGAVTVVSDVARFGTDQLAGASTVDLNDNTTNKTIVAKAMKEINVSTTGPVVGSVYRDLYDLIATIVQKLPSGTISDFDLSDLVDGKPVSEILELVMCMVDGRFRKDFPNVGDITFYKRDNTTVLTAVNVTTSERTRY